MAMPRASSGWTAEMLEALPDDGRRYEIVDGELLASPSPLRRHQRMGMLLAPLLNEYAERIGAGAAVPDADVGRERQPLVIDLPALFARVGDDKLG